jgi:CDP-diacylglycerol--glycerol-3-phosphate 3-phosphatidyltransferase
MTRADGSIDAAPPAPQALSNRIVTAPNVLSVARLIIASALPFISPDWRLTLFLAGAVSDWVDGFLAKVTQTRTVLGQILDPIADKALILAALLTLVLNDEVRWWQVGLVLLRDLSVVVAAAVAAGLREWSGFRRMPPKFIGKVTTVLVFVWIVVEFVTWPWVAGLRVPIFIAAAVCSAWSAAAYSDRAIREWHARRARTLKSDFTGDRTDRSQK